MCSGGDTLALDDRVLNACWFAKWFLSLSMISGVLVGEWKDALLRRELTRDIGRGEVVVENVSRVGEGDREGG